LYAAIPTPIAPTASAVAPNTFAPVLTRGLISPPGATPPVGSEPMKKLKPQPQNDKNGDQPDVQGGEDSYETIRDRKKGSTPKQTMQANAGATFQSYGEETESDEEVIEEEKKEGHEDAAADKKLIKKMISKEKMKEDIDALLSGENLSEEFVTKASTIFEAAVIARAEEVIAEAEEQLIEQFEAAVEEIKEDLAAKVDDYLNYMVEEWIKDNEIAIEKGLRAEIVEDFITGLKGLFEEHYIDIPEDKVNVVEEFAEQVEVLESELDKAVTEVANLNAQINVYKKEQVVSEVSEGLSEVQSAKLKSLAEGIEFVSEQDYKEKLLLTKKKYFDESTQDTVKKAAPMDDDVSTIEESFSPVMSHYVQNISRTLKK